MSLISETLKMRIVFAMAVVIPALSLCAHSAEGDLGRRIDAIATNELRKTGLPSLQIAVGRSDGKDGARVVFENAYGLADVENNVTATTATKYRTASVPKWFAATVSMSLAERGTLDIDKPVQTYCPEFPEKRWPVTTRHLLTHTAGVRHYSFHQTELANAKSQEEREKIEMRWLRDQIGTYSRYTDVIAPLENFKRDPLMFEPGTSWSYSSHGYRVLACVLQGASGKNYSKLMDEMVYVPAKMINTVEDDAIAIVPHRAAGYTLGRNGKLERAELRDVSENLGAGGHLSTAGDLVKFALDFDRGRLVSAKTRALMSTPLVASDPNGAWSEIHAAPSRERYGYGTMMFPSSTGAWIGHTGRIAGATTIVILDPKRHFAIAVMTNAKFWNGSIELTRAIAEVVESRFGSAE